MLTNIPQVSIIMATYNRAHLIKDTLDSILNQSFKNWECLIIDDGSTDNTKGVIRNFLSEDSRFRYIKRSNQYHKGISGCRNFGIEIAQGHFIIFFDDDDIVHPDNLKICTELLSDKELYFCRYEKEPFQGDWKLDTLRYDPDFISKFVEINELENVITGNLAFASCTVLWKKECFEDNRFNEELLYAEEWECYTRILSGAIKGISIDKVLYYNRKHPTSNTGEFHNFDPVRRTSHLMAIKLVINNLTKNGLLSPNLVQYFIRTGFLLKEISVIEDVLKHSNAGTLKRLKYLWGFRIYPVLRPFFNLKAKIKKS